jgi:hypothetical protein
MQHHQGNPICHNTVNLQVEIENAIPLFVVYYFVFREEYKLYEFKSRTVSQLE